MLEGNTDEIRMEIQSCSVKTHEYWEKRRGGKNWIANITGQLLKVVTKDQAINLIQKHGQDHSGNSEYIHYAKYARLKCAVIATRKSV